MKELPWLVAKKDSDSERESRLLNSKQVFFKVAINTIE